MSHTMNGHPFWCPPARQKDYGFNPIETKSDTVSVSLAEAALLVRHAIKQGLIKLPDKAEVKAAKLGVRSVWATCQQCQGEFSRDKFSSEPRCQSCRLGRKTCGECGLPELERLRKLLSSALGAGSRSRNGHRTSLN